MKNTLTIEAGSGDVKQMALAFIDAFRHSNRPKYLFGNNVFADGIISAVKIEGIIDEKATDNHYQGIPFTPLEKVPADALVLVLSGGSPLTALNKVDSYGLTCLHYFSFYKHARLPLVPIPFEGNTAAAYKENSKKYEHIFSLLADTRSQEEFEKVINFRVSLDVIKMQGFTTREDEQYFESFLNLKQAGESFVDIGAYDGFTTESFIQQCPDYTSVDLFEPDPENISVARQRLEGKKNIFFHEVGLSNHTGKVSFSQSGSGSSISASGNVSIKLDMLDKVLSGPVSFIKIDIEGGEYEALKGACETIREYHPKLAVAVYHHPDDFWKIPEFIMSVRNDYDIFFRHYTESLYESVMFFVPETK